MKKYLSVIMSALAALGMFLLGFLIRQPKINKLKKQIVKLQDDNTLLLEIEEKLHKDFANLLAQHKALKVYELKAKTQSKEGLHQNLVFQYAMNEYLELLLNRVRTESKMTNEEKVFFHAYEKVINGSKLSTGDMSKIRDYICEKYDAEIKQLKECDCTATLNELQEQHL